LPLIARLTSSAVGFAFRSRSAAALIAHTRGAEAALHRVVLDEGFLDRVKLIAAREPLNRGDGLRIAATPACRCPRPEQRRFLARKLADSCRIRAVVAPSRMIAISTTIAAR
jgi:hypothetical protein